MRNMNNTKNRIIKKENNQSNKMKILINNNKMIYNKNKIKSGVLINNSIKSIKKMKK